MQDWGAGGVLEARSHDGVSQHGDPLSHVVGEVLPPPGNRVEHGPAEEVEAGRGAHWHRERDDLCAARPGDIASRKLAQAVLEVDGYAS